MSEKNVPDKPERREFVKKTALATAAAVAVGVAAQAQNVASSSTKALQKPIRAEVIKSEETKTDNVTEHVGEVKYIGADGAYQISSTYVQSSKTDQGHNDVVVVHMQEFTAAGTLVRTYSFTTLATVNGNVVKTKTIKDGKVLTYTATMKVPPEAASTEALTPQQIVDNMLARKGLN